ncbi:acetyl-CoA synthetase-like protein [Pseudovirgaria hyperparasitica]|uniref:Acetyl-CoA synthetase-like protein n=1 Tax=Pseudovirgaria hyperparasitica TaxID=470096 RepID=A0A6A6VT36_9PEZI|nr:acetyl-CoA synthetase-like protein [Pseudovirgaria hyperparasitica]KAF2752946.1 acetyl-CoA synthetase-like protein [Pseudovirgaria hyperparasitica]
MADQFKHILRQLCDSSNSTKRIAEIEVISKMELDIIWTWNAKVPTTIEALVHDLIADTCRKQRHATAIHAWDGMWTYTEVHDMSTRLAHHLVHLGVGCETVVPLCFEKSKWTPIAILAVMKAGGTCVTLDPALPQDRLYKIVQQIEPSIILSSFTNRHLSSRLYEEKAVIVVNDTLRPLFDKQTLQLLLEVQPSQTLYIVFTSGSTGTPKGVRISHSNFSSALRYQNGAHNLGPGARIYDFASYAFDVSWSNVLGALECGACLCIPTDAERRDDLAGSLRRFRVTHVKLTSSTASLLPQKTIQSLDTLILGGERLSEEQAKVWASLVTLKNSYGPCECTPTATVADIRPGGDMTTIRIGLGVNTWIVDSASGQSLVPIRSIGELVLEGPLVGSGYLNSPTSIFSAFIEDPP